MFLLNALGLMGESFTVTRHMLELMSEFTYTNTKYTKCYCQYNWKLEITWGNISVNNKKKLELFLAISLNLIVCGIFTDFTPAFYH